MKVTLDLSEYMLPKFYQTHFQRQLSRSQFLVLEIVLNLLSSEKQVRLERLARVFRFFGTYRCSIIRKMPKKSSTYFKINKISQPKSTPF